MTVTGILQGAELWPELSLYPKIGYYSRAVELLCNSESLSDSTGPTSFCWTVVRCQSCTRTPLASFCCSQMLLKIGQCVPNLCGRMLFEFLKRGLLYF